jgi:hypothetical protein
MLDGKGGGLLQMLKSLHPFGLSVGVRNMRPLDTGRRLVWLALPLHVAGHHASTVSTLLQILTSYNNDIPRTFTAHRKPAHVACDAPSIHQVFAHKCLGVLSGPAGWWNWDSAAQRHVAAASHGWWQRCCT